MRGREREEHNQLCNPGPSKLDMALVSSVSEQMWDRL